MLMVRMIMRMMMKKRMTKVRNIISRNEQDTHMFDTEEQELNEKASKELRSSTVSGYKSTSTSYIDKNNFLRDDGTLELYS